MSAQTALMPGSHVPAHLAWLLRHAMQERPLARELQACGQGGLGWLQLQSQCLGPALEVEV